MFKTFIVLQLVFLGLQGAAQQTDKLSLETGLVISKYFAREKTRIDNSQPLNCFVRLEYTGKTFSNLRWSLFIPMGITYTY